MATSRRVEHPSVEDRKAHGKASRSKVALSSHAGWTAAADRADPVALLEEQNLTREADLVPVRHGRMLVMKGSAVVESLTPLGLTFYARQCGWTLARAHARSGDPVAIAAHLGKSDEFDTSITDFSLRYADQNDRDYEAFAAAVRSGRLAAVEGV